MEQLKAYKFRIYPTEEQEIFFAKSFGCVRKGFDTLLALMIKENHSSRVQTHY
ncbi:hypothetical protein EfmAA290_14280 [Enterococcus faecium]|nr:hypothetical protein EfmAA290_14280 [Enterococcus faecium]